MGGMLRGVLGRGWISTFTGVDEAGDLRQDVRPAVLERLNLDLQRLDVLRELCLEFCGGGAGVGMCTSDVCHCAVGGCLERRSRQQVVGGGAPGDTPS